MDLLNDPRWLRLHDNSWICPCCGQSHVGLFDLGTDAPSLWQDSISPESNKSILEASHILTKDFCIFENEHYFVRCVLLLPIIGTKNDFFGYGVWSSLSKANFYLYLEHYNEPVRSQLGPWFGWFSNSLKGYPETLSLKVHVLPQDNEQRPILELEPCDHPLSLEQRDGITFDRILELYALNGHDIRDSLTQKH
ncbi:MAG: DUF2199 domain-containing protein [Alphaproteobacteria bacterium]|nr:DUF2199 domain-containing protein [Alphaproteobacteria bacterium]QQS58156.1 MAG: DUF2199 domain-containing protein [Alphaproteobacteria bacterium]